MKKLLIFGLPLILLAFGLVLGCSSSDDSGPSGKSDWEPWVSIGVDGNSNIKVTITTTRPRIILTPTTNDSYIIEKDGVEVSSGYIEVTKGQDFTFHQIAPEAAVFTGLFNGGILSFTSGPFVGFKQTSGVGAGDVGGDRDKPSLSGLTTYFVEADNDDPAADPLEIKQTKSLWFYFSRPLLLTTDNFVILSGEGIAYKGADPDKGVFDSDLTPNTDNTAWNLKVDTRKTGIISVSVHANNVDSAKKSLVVFDAKAPPSGEYEKFFIIRGSTLYGDELPDPPFTTGSPVTNPAPPFPDSGQKSYLDTKSIFFIIGDDDSADPLERPLTANDIMIEGYFYDSLSTSFDQSPTYGRGEVTKGALLKLRTEKNAGNSLAYDVYELKLTKVVSQGGLKIWINHKNVNPAPDYVDVFKAEPIGYRVVQSGGRPNSPTAVSTTTTGLDLIFDRPMSGRSVDPDLDGLFDPTGTVGDGLVPLIEVWEPRFDNLNATTNVMTYLTGSVGATAVGDLADWVDGTTGTFVDSIEDVSDEYGYAADSEMVWRVVLDTPTTKVQAGKVKVRINCEGIKYKVDGDEVELYIAPIELNATPTFVAGGPSLTIVLKKQAILTASNIIDGGYVYDTVDHGKIDRAYPDNPTARNPSSSDGITWSYTFELGDLATDDKFDFTVIHPLVKPTAASTVSITLP
jgi:hypothetical protein